MSGDLLAAGAKSAVKTMSKLLGRSLSVRDPRGRFKNNSTWDKFINRNRNKRLYGEQYFCIQIFVVLIPKGMLYLSAYLDWVSKN